MYLLITFLIGSFSLSSCTNQQGDHSPKEIIQSNTSQSVILNSDEATITLAETSEDVSLVGNTEKIETVNLEEVEESKAPKIVAANKSLDAEEAASGKLINVYAEKSSSRKKTQDQVKLEVQSTDSESAKIEARENQENRVEEKNEVNTTQDKGITEEIAETGVVKSVFNHDEWHTILQANVSSSGKVNYDGIKSNIKQLDGYLDLLSKNTPKSSWAKNKTKAYWINAYNAFTIKLILDNYPVGSITDLHGGKPWDKKWIELGNKTYSLNDIEHVILRPTYNDPRIHFAVNCAAKSCPKVWNNAWTEKNIESALDKLTKEFVSNTSANQISENSVNLSKIFDWYGEDFGDLIQFLNKYSATKISPKAKIAFNDYNWKLNS